MKLLFTLSFCFFISFLTCFRGNYVFLGISNLVEIWWELKRRVRLCLVRVKAFPENILFSGKENIFMCLAATKFVLRKINSGVWFIQTFLQKKQNLAKKFHTHSSNPAKNSILIHQIHTHSQKKQNPAKKFIISGQIEIAQQRRRWDHAGEARSVRSSDERLDRRSRSSDNRAVRRLTSALAITIDEGRNRPMSTLVGRSRCSSITGSLFSLVGRSPPLSIAGSLFFLSLSPIWALSSLSLSLSENDLNWK